MLRRTFLSAPVLAGAGILASCAKPARKTSRMTLRISANSRLTMCPFYVAYESGYFTDAGFDIDLVKDLGTALSLPLLAGGKLDGSFNTYGPPMINAVVRGARVRVVAGREIVSPSCGTAGTVFVSRARYPHGARGMRQLKGARIGMSVSTPQTLFWLDTLLQHEGMSESDVVLRKMSETERMAAVRKGAIDAFISTDSDLTTELEPLGLLAGPNVASVLPNYQFSHIFFGSRLLDGPVDTGARFLRAYFRGAGDFLRGRTPRFLDEFAKRSNLDPKLVRERCRATFEPDGKIHLDDMRRYTEWMSAHSMCPANVDASASVDNRFLEALRTMK